MAARASALPLPQQPLCSQQPQPSTVPGALRAPRAPHGPPQNSALAAYGAACSRAGTYSRGATKTRLTARRQTGARLILRPSVPLADSLRLESCCLSVRAQRPPARQLAGSSAFAQQSAASCSPPFGAAQRRGGRAGGSAYICHRPQQPHSAARRHRAWFVSSLQGSQMGWLHVGHTARSGRAGERGRAMQRHPLRSSGKTKSCWAQQPGLCTGVSPARLRVPSSLRPSNTSSTPSLLSLLRARNQLKTLFVLPRAGQAQGHTLRPDAAAEDLKSAGPKRESKQAGAVHRLHCTTRPCWEQGGLLG